MLLREVGTYKIFNAKVSKGELRLNKKDQATPPKVSPRNIFEEEKPRWKFWRNPKRIIVHIEGNMRPLEIEEIEGGESRFKLGFLTLDDIVDAVKKTIVLNISKLKPMKTEFFIILAVIGVMNLGIAIYNFITLSRITGG